MEINEVNTQALTIKDAKEFIFAGKAIFTIENEGTQARLTFKVEKPKDRRHALSAPHFVRYLTGPDNTSHYTYVGTIWGDRHELRLTKASRMTDDSRPVKVFRWLMDRLDRGNLPQTVKIYHEGRCGRCGRLLTVPESIKSGLGPVCSGKINLVDFDA